MEIQREHLNENHYDDVGDDDNDETVSHLMNTDFLQTYYYALYFISLCFQFLFTA